MSIKISDSMYVCVAVAAMGLMSQSAHADLTLGLTPTSAVAGGSGAFDVTLTASGSSYSLAGFTFDLSVPGGSGISFTNAGMNTTGTYIFSGNSFDTSNSLPFSLSTFPTTDVNGSDLANVGSTLLMPGSTFDLGHIDYAVAGGTSTGPVTVTIENPGADTSLSDPSGLPITFTANNGSIQVVAAVPEPGAGAALLGGLAVAAGGMVRSRRSRKRGQ